MYHQKFGKTGLELSAIGFGASPLGNVYADIGRLNGMRAVTHAIDQGINLFDVSPYYGSTLAEECLGEALLGRRAQIVLATKCGRYGVDTFDFSAKAITLSLEDSLRRLRTDYVDVLQAHDIEFGNLQMIVHETVPALQLLKQQGKVRFIGLAGYWPGMLARVAAQADVDCLLNYCHANLFVDDMDAHLVPFIKASGIGLLNASPLHMGLLSSRPVPAWHPAPQIVRDAAVQVRLACGRFGVDAATLGLRICLDQRAVASTLVGLSSKAEVDAACAALAWAPPDELLKEVQAIVEPVHNIVWPSGRQESSEDVTALKGSSDVTH